MTFSDLAVHALDFLFMVLCGIWFMAFFDAKKVRDTMGMTVSASLAVIMFVLYLLPK